MPEHRIGTQPENQKTPPQNPTAKNTTNPTPPPKNGRRKRGKLLKEEKELTAAETSWPTIREMLGYASRRIPVRERGRHQDARRSLQTAAPS